MSAFMWLTEEELEALTRRKQPLAQGRVLKEAKIHYTMVDGRPIVLRCELEQTPAVYEPQLILKR